MAFGAKVAFEHILKGTGFPDFLKDVESIQNDFVELSRKMEFKQTLEK